MIKADAFHRAFDRGFSEPATAAGLTRRRGRASIWLATRPAGSLTLSVRVNPKASALPFSPGEFSLDWKWEGPRTDPADDGTVSHFQYDTEADRAALPALNAAVLDRAERLEAEPAPLRAGRDALLAVRREGLALPPVPNHPGHAFYYLDESDADAWGRWLGARLSGWLTRFDAAPETLQAWCWRVLWKDLPRR